MTKKKQHEDGLTFNRNCAICLNVAADNIPFAKPMPMLVLFSFILVISTVLCTQKRKLHREAMQLYNQRHSESINNERIKLKIKEK